MECDANPGWLGPGDSRPPSQVGSVAQSQVRMPSQKDPQGGSNNQPGRWRNSSRADSNKVRSLEIALNSLSPEESGARVELQAALRRAKEVTQKPVQRSSTTPDVRAAKARVKVAKLEKLWRRPREASVRADRRLQEFHRSSREAIGEVGRRARVGARSVGGGARTACASGGQRRSFRSFATVSPCCSDGSRVGASASRVGRRTHTGSPIPQSSPGGFCPQHSGRAALWMRCRQQDMEDAIAQGSEGDVSRLAHVIAEGAIQLRQWTQPPSSVVNMVS